MDAPPKGALQLSMEQPEVGDHWTIEVRNGLTGALQDVHTVTITVVTATEIGLRADTVGRPGFRSETYDRFWNLRKTSGKEFALGDGTGIKLPLKVGNTWNIPTAHVGQVILAGTAKVLAEQDLTTRAGSFHAFEIETSFHIYTPTITTLSDDLVFTSWYAPSVDHWVKRTVKVLHNGAVTREIAAEVVTYGRR